jgi:hypothetical protein
VSKEVFYLVIGGGAIDAAVVSGGAVARSHRTEIAAESSHELWGTDLRALDGALAQLVRVLNVSAGTPTVVCYEAPRSAVEVFCVPAKGSEALAAASLSLSEVMGGASEFCATGLEVLWSSRSRGATRTMILAAGESDTTPESICELVERAGLSCTGIVPARAAAIVSCWKRPDAHTATDLVLIDVGADCTTMIGVIDGELRLVRQVSLGTDLFIEAYERAMRAARGDQVAPPTRAEAARAFWSHGIPARELVIDGAGRTRGEDVLPLLQPVVQRLAVEIKQTLRFGIDADGRPIPIRVVGHACRVPAFVALLADYADCAIDAEPQDAAPDAAGSPAARVASAVSGQCRGINLLPPKLVDRSRATALRRTALVGAGVASIFIAGEAALLARSLGDTRAQLSAARPEVATLRQQMEMREDAARLGQVLTEAQSRLSSVVPSRTPWSALFARIQHLTGSGITLSDLAAGFEQQTPVITLRGIADSGDESSETLKQFVAELSATPEIERVTLGSTRLQEIDGHQTRGFSIVLHVRTQSHQTTAMGDNK